jgi:hypothetical protein
LHHEQENSNQPLSVDAADAARMRSLAEGSFDWDAFLLAASRNHVLGLAAQRLQDACADAIPAATLEFLRDCSRKTVERNRYLMLRPRLNQELAEHTRIVSRSHDMGDWIPLKTKLVACNGALSRIHLWHIENKRKRDEEKTP